MPLINDEVAAILKRMRWTWMNDTWVKKDSLGSIIARKGGAMWDEDLKKAFEEARNAI
jgi:hypothetical protein